MGRRTTVNFQRSAGHRRPSPPLEKRPLHHVASSCSASGALARIDSQYSYQGGKDETSFANGDDHVGDILDLNWHGGRAATDSCAGSAHVPETAGREVGQDPS